jgi:nucleotide-binding universal stress UspA family protein
MLASDGSEGAARAAQFIGDLAAALGTHVIVAAVAADHDPVMLPWDTFVEEHPVPTASAAGWVRGHAERLKARGINVADIVLEGHPADALIAEAAMCSVSMIVVGRHGSAHHVSPLPGSVVEELARRSPCPLVVVP